MKKQISLMSTLVILMMISLTAQANLLLNSSFESGLTDWQSSGNAAIRTSDPIAHDGTNYIYGSNTPLFTVSQNLNKSSEIVSH